MKRIIGSFLLILISVITGFAQGYYIEFKMTSDKANGTTKVYSQDGNSRSEVNLSIAAPNASAPMKQSIVSLVLKDKPDMVYLLNDDKKTYSEMNISSHKQATSDDYEVTVIGKEKVNGYNATHVKIVNKKDNAAQEMWTSKDVAHYSELASIKSKYTGEENMEKALAAKGADGFPVRLIATQGPVTIQVDLEKAEARSNPASLFSLDGYTKGGSTGNMDPQEMAKQIQNMTPEQRQQYIDQMRQQYAPK